MVPRTGTLSGQGETGGKRLETPPAYGGNSGELVSTRPPAVVNDSWGGVHGPGTTRESSSGSHVGIPPPPTPTFQDLPKSGTSDSVPSQGLSNDPLSPRFGLRPSGYGRGPTSSTTIRTPSLPDPVWRSTGGQQRGYGPKDLTQGFFYVAHPTHLDELCHVSAQVGANVQKPV